MSLCTRDPPRQNPTFVASSTLIRTLITSWGSAPRISTSRNRGWRRECWSLARAAFDSATELLQRQRATVSGGAERAAFLDDARATIDQIVAFHADRNSKDAFEGISSGHVLRACCWSSSQRFAASRRIWLQWREGFLAALQQCLSQRTTSSSATPYFLGRRSSGRSATIASSCTVSPLPPPRSRHW